MYKMLDVEEYVDANENDNNLSLKVNFKSYFREYWLAIITALFCLCAIIQSSFIPLNLNEDFGAHIISIPANFFFRHVRGFVLLFIIFASINKAAVIFESKRSTVKCKILIHYFGISLITLVITLCAGYLIIIRRQPNVETNFFSSYIDSSYDPFNNFITFVRGIFVNDIPAHIINARSEHYDDYGKLKIVKGLGDDFNVPGFVIFGSLIGFSTYFLAKDGEILRNLFQLVHRSMLSVYWILLCYSPIALYLGGIANFDVIRKEKLYGFVVLRYVLLVTAVLVVALLQIFIIFPCFHFVRTRKFGYDVIFRISSLFPDVFIEGSNVRMVDKTKQYLKSRRFSSEAIDSYLNYCTLINGAGSVSGFAINAIFALKLCAVDIDWAMVVKIMLTSLLIAIPATEYIQGYMFGIIFFLNSTLINPDIIVIILLVDWLADRIRMVSNIISDALTIDYIESMNKTSNSSTPSL